jgi:hypothetical protein
MIKELVKEFTGVGEVKGFIFRQVEFTQQAYTYEVSCGNKLYYEVFKRIKSPVCIDFEKRIYSDTEFKEKYPNSNKFGKTAFTFKNKIDAINKMLDITKDELLKLTI